MIKETLINVKDKFNNDNKIVIIWNTKKQLKKGINKITEMYNFNFNNIIIGETKLYEK